LSLAPESGVKTPISAVDRFIAQSRQQAPESLGQTGDYGVLCRAGFQSLEYRMKAEASIGRPVRYWNVPLERRNEAVSMRSRPKTMG
jgi:hypothetical protein